MPGSNPEILKPKVVALQRDLASLLKLLGGDADDRLRFWEILKGITKPAELELASHQLDVMQGMVKQLAANTKMMEKTAKLTAKAKAVGA